MRYFIKNNGCTYGPLEETEIKRHVSSGFFAETCRLSTDRKLWKPLAHYIAIEANAQAAYDLHPTTPSSATTSHTLPPTTFMQVCQRYQSAVGLVTASLAMTDGKKLPSLPIGTAFAVSNNKFVTNCHVVYGLKELKKDALDSIIQLILKQDAAQQGISTPAEFKAFCKEQARTMSLLRQALQEKLVVKNIQLRMAHSGGTVLNITDLHIHPLYQHHPAASQLFKNGEYDVALLTTDRNTDTFFPIATDKRLLSLAQGETIAYMGFPMEGLQDCGNLNLSYPEATFKSGTINKITDFNNIFSQPANNKSIIHDIPAVGGASGSPIFLPNGHVVAVLWGGATTGRNENGDRIASAAQQNMAVRIDSLKGVSKHYSLAAWLK